MTANFLHSGYVAVSAFFVLSGFVLAYNHRLDCVWTRREVGVFLVARLARIYPLYLLALALLVPYTLVELYRDPRGWAWQAKTFAVTAAMIQAWMPSWATLWNYPGWSLSDEMFFYLCFPFAGVLVWRIATTRRCAVICGLAFFAAEMVVPMLAMAKPIHGFGNLTADVEPTNLYWAAFVKYDPLFRLPDFLIGVLTARIYQQELKRPTSAEGRGYKLYAPALAVWIGSLLCSSRIPYPLLHNGLLTPIFACIVLGLALGGGRLSEMLSAPLLVQLGQASYALYILQVPLWIWLNSALGHTVGTGKLTGMRLFVLYAALAIAASLLAFRWIEEPCNKALRRRFPGTKRDTAPSPIALQTA